MIKCSSISLLHNFLLLSTSRPSFSGGFFLSMIDRLIENYVLIKCYLIKGARCRKWPLFLLYYYNHFLSFNSSGVHYSTLISLLNKSPAKLCSNVFMLTLIKSLIHGPYCFGLCYHLMHLSSSINIFWNSNFDLIVSLSPQN